MPDGLLAAGWLLTADWLQLQSTEHREQRAESTEHWHWLLAGAEL
jgi:hypothetical protein